MSRRIGTKAQRIESVVDALSDGPLPERSLLQKLAVRWDEWPRDCLQMVHMAMLAREVVRIGNRPGWYRVAYERRTRKQAEQQAGPRPMLSRLGWCVVRKSTGRDNDNEVYTARPKAADVPATCRIARVRVEEVLS